MVPSCRYFSHDYPTFVLSMRRSNVQWSCRLHRDVGQHTHQRARCQCRMPQLLGGELLRFFLTTVRHALLLPHTRARVDHQLSHCIIKQKASHRFSLYIRMQAVQVAFNGGTIAALVVVSLAVLGICVMYVLFESMYAGAAGIRSHDIPLLMVCAFGIWDQRLTSVLLNVLKF